MSSWRGRKRRRRRRWNVEGKEEFLHEGFGEWKNGDEAG